MKYFIIFDNFLPFKINQLYH